MKNKHLFIAGFTAIAAAFSSCSKEELIGTMSADVDGTQWTATAQGAVSVQNRFVITGSTASSSIVLSPNGNAVGTYTTNVFSGSVQPFVYTPSFSNAQDTYVGSGGSIVIQSVAANRLTGTFAVTATNTQNNSKTISGSFKNILVN